LPSRRCRKEKGGSKGRGWENLAVILYEMLKGDQNTKVQGPEPGGFCSREEQQRKKIGDLRESKSGILNVLFKL